MLVYFDMLVYGDKKLFEGRYSNLERHKYDTMGDHRWYEYKEHGPAK
jgi:hypothetical protein